MNRTHIGLGVFVVLSVGLLVYLAQQIGALGGGGGDPYTVRLKHAAGLVDSNAVKIAGVKVGRIEGIDVDHDIAVLHLRIDPEVELHEGTTAIVRAKSLLGEKYLQLDPGDREAAVLPPGSQIEKVLVPFEIDEVLNALQPILGSEDSIAAVIGPTAKKLDKILTEVAGGEGEKPVLTRADLEQMTEDLKATTASLRRMTEGNEEKFQKIVDQTETILASPRVPRILANTDKITADVAERLPGLMDRTDKTLARLEELTAIVDEKRAKEIRKIIDDGSIAMANLRKASGDLDGIGRDIKPLLRSLKAIARRAAEIDEAVVRRFLQREGVKIYFGSKRKAAAALDDVPE